LATLLKTLTASRLVLLFIAIYMYVIRINTRSFLDVDDNISEHAHHLQFTFNLSSMTTFTLTAYLDCCLGCNASCGMDFAYIA